MFSIGEQLDRVDLECFTHSLIYSRVDAIDIWGWTSFAVGARPVHCRMFSSVLASTH